MLRLNEDQDRRAARRHSLTEYWSTAHALALVKLSERGSCNPSNVSPRFERYVYLPELTRGKTVTHRSNIFLAWFTCLCLPFNKHINYDSFVSLPTSFPFRSQPNGNAARIFIERPKFVLAFLPFGVFDPIRHL